MNMKKKTKAKEGTLRHALDSLEYKILREMADRTDLTREAKGKLLGLTGQAYYNRLVRAGLQDAMKGSRGNKTKEQRLIAAVVDVVKGNRDLQDAAIVHKVDVEEIKKHLQ